MRVVTQNFVVDYTNERKKNYIPVDIKSSKSSIYFSGGRFKDNAFVTY